jgi:hypothetical protein
MLADGRERPPCPVCGATAINVAVAIAITVHPSISVSYVARTTNTAATRRVALESAVRSIEQAVAGGSTHDSQQALKAALEAIHELGDCLRRGEWAQAGWSVDDLVSWHAHIGARNAAHHTSSAIAATHSAVNLDDRLRWDIDPQAVASLQSQRQARDYLARLDGQPVLPPLRALAGRVSSAVT